MAIFLEARFKVQGSLYRGKGQGSRFKLRSKVKSTRSKGQGARFKGNEGRAVVLVPCTLNLIPALYLAPLPCFSFYSGTDGAN